RFCVSAARSNTRLNVLSLATSPCRRKYNSRILRGPQAACASFRRTISHTSSSGSCSEWLFGRRLFCHPGQSFAPKTLSPLVPRLGTDPVLLTQRSEIERPHRS